MRNTAEVAIPGLAAPFSLSLSPEIAALRERALARHCERGPVELSVPELTLIDANAWAAHRPGEDWLTWRARCRMRSLRGPNMPGSRVRGGAS